MRGIAILTLISLTSISVFWYTEVATPYQKEFTQGKAKEVGGAVLETGASLSKKVIGTGEELYDDREVYIDQAKKFGQKSLETGEKLKERGQEFWNDQRPLIEGAKDSAGNLIKKVKDNLPEF
jgi:hypothetical protein